MERERRWADKGEAIGHGVSWLARWSLRVALAALGFWMVVWVIGQLWVVVMPVLLGLLITTVLWPPARWLMSKGLNSALSATIVLVVGLAVLGGVIAAISTSIASGVPEIAQSAQKAVTQLQDWASGPPFNLKDTDLDRLIAQGVDQVKSSIGSIANGLLTGAGAVTSGVVTGLVALLLAFFFVKDGMRFTPWVRGLIGERAGGHVTTVLERVWVTLGSFIRSQAIVSLIDAVFIGLGLVILGVPLAIPLAALTFLGGFIPIIGAFIAGALAVLVALVSNGLTTAIIMLVIVIVVQQVEGNVLQPILQSRSLRLHAAVVLLVVTAGTSIYGIAGAFFSVPVAAAVAVVMRYLGEVIEARSVPVMDTSHPDGDEPAETERSPE
ncbi:AI-2E family transporter [Lentzea sp. BCCO 10_0856]|uniref:AI-2E family transporter n=1 Tax=Lentzea miocenica TaxID=3095431 RepID=A0ABU4SWF8_9PSEU|nr:AI-2E family transporter [Lentzea sp. BCCO 10_0856]MDX8030083.1 AI-2E family transporter [Lentzea sp. BCCO 10_0856]